MGWLFMHRPKGYTDRQWFEREWGPEFSKRIIETATKNSVLYAALECDDERLLPNADGKRVVALVYKLKWVPKDPNYNFGYKDMSEFSGPCEVDCPAKILKLLSPFDPKFLEPALKEREQALTSGQSEGVSRSILWAYDWRQECWEAVRKRTELQVGATYKAPKLVRFRDGVEADQFRLIEKKGRRKIWRRPDGIRVRLSEEIVRTFECQR